jgi:hypothetical protein
MNRISTSVISLDIGDSPSWGGMISFLLLLGGALGLILLVSPELKLRVTQYGSCGGICFLLWILGFEDFPNMVAYPLILVTMATIIYHTARCVFKPAKSIRKSLVACWGIAAFLLCCFAFVFYACTAAFFPAGTYCEKSKRQLILLSCVLKSRTDSWAKGDKSLSLPDLSSFSFEEQSIPESFEKDGVYEGYQYSIANSESRRGFCLNAVPIVEKGEWPSFRAEINDARPSLGWTWWDLYCHIQYAYKEGDLAPPNAKHVCKRGILDLFVGDLGPRRNSASRLKEPEMRLE